MRYVQTGIREWPGNETRLAMTYDVVNLEHASGYETAVAYQTRPRATQKTSIVFMYVPSNLKLQMTDY